MKILTLAGIFLLSAANFLTAQILCRTASAANSPAIYHDGWIDLNKNGTGLYEDSS